MESPSAASSGTPPIAAIIVAYGEPDSVSEAVASLQAGHLVPERIIVVDHSPVDSPALELPEYVQRISDPSNPGFAAGVNRAVRTVPDGFDLFLLNPDARVGTSTLSKLAGVGACRPTLGAASVVIECAPAGDMPWFEAGWVRPLLADLRHGKRRDPDGDCAFVSGAAMWIRRAAWNGVGEFNEKYFLYCEDTDWCLRARDAGWRVAVVPDNDPAARATHRVSSSVAAGTTGTKTYYIARNTWRLILDRVGLLPLLPFALPRMLLIGLRVDDRRSWFAGLADGLKGRMGMAPGVTGASQRTRVYHMITELEPAGAERVLYEIARGLNRENFDVRVCALRGGGSVGVWLRAAGIPVIEVGTRSGWRRLPSLPGAFLRVLRDMRRFSPDIVHTHLFHAGVAGRLAALLACDTRVVSQVHTVEDRDAAGRVLFDRATRPLIDAEICVSHAVAAERRARIGLPAHKLRVLSNGVDLTRARDSSIVTRMKATTLLVPGIPTLIAVGRLDPVKGFDLLVAAAPALLQELPDLQIVIVGEGPDRNRLERQIAELGLLKRIRLAGHREDIGRFLAAADVVVMPSRLEGFGIVAVEAMAAGVPVVASSVDSLPEIISDGETGILVPPEDPAALAEATLRLFRDPELRARLGAQGRLAAESYTVPRMLEGLEAIYASL